MNKRFETAMDESPIIAAVKDMDGLHRCLESESKIIFILFGDICNIIDIVNKIKSEGKIAIVHVDLINGLSTKEISVDYIKNNTEADGIISTKQALIKRAKELHLFTVFRFFVIDSMAFENIQRQSETVKPDYVEILPGVMPKVIKRLSSMISIPIIAGGLISDKEDAMSALSAGAVSISTTNQKVWFM
ncbi:MAG: glycerol-3-phosphate responsive antiterminator, GlpP [Clostridiales bacterium]|jgi:glycerol uptake operon antiterminator|nr:glycerol-3-phosphate responsive antiterminator, GlpP [Clostridiales bacterium]